MKKKLGFIAVGLVIFISASAQSFTNPSLENWGAVGSCGVNIAPDNWTNYSNGNGQGPDEANFTLCPTSIPANASNGIVYARMSARTDSTGEGMFQNISGFTICTSYAISFDYAGSNLYGGTSDIQWHLFIDDIDVSQTPVYSSTNANWASQTFTFTATKAIYKIGVRAYTVPASSVPGSGAIDNFKLTATHSSGPTVTLSSQVNVLCHGGTNGAATISVSSGTAPYTYAWSPSGGSNASVSNLTAGTHSVIVADKSGCSSTHTLSITEPAVITVATSMTNDTCGNGNGTANVLVNGGTAPYTYTWSPSGGNNSSAINLSAGNYAITITDANGCIKISNDTITEIPCPCPDLNLTLPNAFSPNNDGENDRFCLQGGIDDCIKEVTITIYNRWGETIYASTGGKSFCWDALPADRPAAAGRQRAYDGKRMNTAIFTYYMEATFISGKRVTKKGNISLLK